MSAPVLLALYLGVALLPLGLAWASLKPPRPLADELAAGAGLLAFAIILAEFVLSGRFRTVSRRIGMDTTMRFHQLLARTALALALVHPFLYVSPFNPPYPWDPTRQLTLTGDIAALAGGIAAFVALPAFVVFSIRRADMAWSYETWRLLHGLGALAIAGALLHHALTAGRYSADPALAGLWIGLTGIAAFSLLWVYALKPLAQLRRPWRVRSVRRIAERTWELTVEPDGHGGLAYEAGQFAWLNVGHAPFSLAENPFSISSAPAQGAEVQFVIKELGDFTGSLGTIAPGTRAYLDAPHGNLVVSGREAPGIALIAGGVGIAPLLGILRAHRLAGDPRPLLLVHANRAESQIVYREELEAAGREPGIEVVHVLGEPPPGWQGATGLVTPELLARLLPDPERRRWLFVLCGPTPMMVAVERALIGLGVPAGRILSERFDYD